MIIIESQLSKAKQVIRLSALGQTPGTNNYPDLNGILFTISDCRRPFHSIETNVLPYLLHNFPTNILENGLEFLSIVLLVLSIQKTIKLFIINNLNSYYIHIKFLLYLQIKLYIV